MPEGRDGSKDTEKQQHKPRSSVAEKKGVDQYPGVQAGEGDPSCTTLLPLKR